MRSPISVLALGLACMSLAAGCGGSSGNNAALVVNPPTGQLSLSLTDGPWHDASAMMLHITGVTLGHAGGFHHIDLPGGPMNVDMMQLQNGASQQLFLRMQVPVGQYEWMRLHVDPAQCYVDDATTGGRHGLHMGPNAANGLEVHAPFEIMSGVHHEFMLTYDLRMGLHHQDMGMMGHRWELHHAMRLIHMQHAGGLTGTIDPALVDVNHPDCDPAPGGNWAYLFPGDATEPDDIATEELDGVPGPIATDRVEMIPATGDYVYHFGHLTEGSYRVAFTCSGEWDEDGDDDYPADPDELFDFQMFSDPVDVVAGQLHYHHLTP